jgi:hypothetical protein
MGSPVNLDDERVVTLTITVFASGAMSVAGNIEDEAYALALLDAAKDSLRSYHRNPAAGLITPARDTPSVQ